MKLIKLHGITILLILSLLVASGCAVSSQQLLGSPNFVAEYLPQVLALEKESGGLRSQLGFANSAGVISREDGKNIQAHYDTYWIYYSAANIYLSSGNQSLLVQAIARAEHFLQKIRDVIDASLDSLESPEHETKPETLSL